MMANEKLKLRVCFETEDLSEWAVPCVVPASKIRIEEVKNSNIFGLPGLQVFLGERVISSINQDDLLYCFRQGRGYEFIEEWKSKQLFGKNLSGKQLLRITELLREYGHKNEHRKQPWA